MTTQFDSHHRGCFNDRLFCDNRSSRIPSCHHRRRNGTAPTNQQQLTVENKKMKRIATVPVTINHCCPSHPMVLVDIFMFHGQGQQGHTIQNESLFCYTVRNRSECYGFNNAFPKVIPHKGNKSTKRSWS